MILSIFRNSSMLKSVIALRVGPSHKNSYCCGLVVMIFPNRAFTFYFGDLHNFYVHYERVKTKNSIDF